jgi:hypothetical protein
MSIKKEKISGRIIDLNIKSASLKSASYDILTEKLTVTFNSGTSYSYYKIPVLTFTKFKLAKSQGVYLNTHIVPNYSYRKVK